MASIVGASRFDDPRLKHQRERAEALAMVAPAMTPLRVTHIPGRPATWRLLVASFLSLYVELLLIRWVPGMVHIVAFFANLVLIAAFLGLGYGMLKPSPGAAQRAGMRLAYLVVGLTIVHLLGVGVSLDSSSAYAVNEVTRYNNVSIPLILVLLGVFGAVVWVTVPLGQMVAEYFDRLPAIPAYSINVGGSLAGVLAFAATARLGLPPMAWFILSFLGLLLLDRHIKMVVPAGVILMALALVWMGDTSGLDASVHWSPYYKVVAKPIDPIGGKLSEGFVLDVNNQFLLSGLDLRPDTPVPAGVSSETEADLRMLSTYYDLPFQITRPERVLILGAGAGNDVAAALRNGVDHVTAVEIDPLVLELGSEHHPERPYASPRVAVVLDDARAYLQRTEERFDMVLFATLDAHGLISSVGSVRLDSFVYTEESLEAARERLTDDGVMILSFGPFREEVQVRQYNTVRRVFQQDPLYLLHDNDHRTIVAGDLTDVSANDLPPHWRRISQTEVHEAMLRHPRAGLTPTDDWPHLYLRDRAVPNEYLWVIGGILAMALWTLRARTRQMKPVDGHFLLLGAGFLLLETKSVTEFALLIGSTWQTNALVFSVILLTVLAANLVVLRFDTGSWLGFAYAGIAASLLAGYVWPVSEWVSHSSGPSFLVAGGYLGTPIFLAAIVFATTLKSSGLGSSALAANLLGAVLGGLLEYSSLSVGIRALSLVAIVMYAGSAILWRLGHSPVIVPSVPARQPL